MALSNVFNLLIVYFTVIGKLIQGCDHVILLGGNYAFAKVEIWAKKSSISLPDIPHPLQNKPGAEILDGALYLCGGTTILRRKYQNLCYKLESSAWEDSSPMIEKRAWFTINRVGHRLVAVGGYNGRRDLDSVEIFTTSNSQWTMEPLHLSQPKRSHCSVAISSDELLVIGGSSSSILDLVEKVNLRTGEVSILSRLPEPRTGAGCTKFGDEIIISGGKSNSGYLSSAISFNLRNLQYSELPSLNVPRYYHTMSVVSGEPVVFGGGYLGTFEVLRNGSWQISNSVAKRSRHAAAVSYC